MPTLEKKNLAIASVTSSLRNLEDSVLDARGDLHSLVSESKAAMRVVGLTPSQRAVLKGCLRRAVRAGEALTSCLTEFHECAEATIREEMEINDGLDIQPLGGGGSKPRPDDEIPDDPPPPPPGGG